MNIYVASNLLLLHPLLQRPSTFTLVWDNMLDKFLVVGSDKLNGPTNFFFFGHTHSMWKFLDKGSNLYSCDLLHSAAAALYP